MPPAGTEPLDRPAPPARHAVTVDWGARIPVRDGLELSANIWRPVGAEGERFPAILEMIPYGKDSWRRNSDVARGEYLAARGFALCRLDVRGTGSSPGLARDEYTAAETEDGVEAVEWLAAQPWCTGAIGMWGISYGGFTSLQVAARRPPHLRAIAPLYATDDRYLDDVHVRGGTLTISEKSQYAVSQLAMNAMPPDPAFRGPGWRDEWRARLEYTPPWLLAWLRHQVDGPYWRRGSLAPQYEALECAVFQVGGWCDSYVDPAFRIQARATSAPHRRSLVGNWVHSFPSDAYPGPNLDWLHELLRFFDRHLRGTPNGWDEEPALTWFEREFAPPEPFPAAWPGRWRAAAEFPVPGARVRAWRFAGGMEPGRGRLLGPAGGSPAAGGPADAEPGSAEPGSAEPAGVDHLVHRPTAGTTGPLSWGSGGAPNGLGGDPRPDEAIGLTYTSDPLPEPLSIIGVPEVVVDVEATMPVALIHARLSDVAPDGTSAPVAAGVLNLTRRRSHTEPEPLVPGTIDTVRVPLRTAGYRWRAGHRLRLTLLTSAWPILLPTPHPGELRVHRGGVHASRLELPVLPDDAPTPAPAAFKLTPPEERPVGADTEDPPEWRIERDVLTDAVTVRTFEGGSTILEDGRELYSSERLTMTASDADPARTTLASDVVYRWQERTFTAEIRSTGSIATDARALSVDLALTVDVDGSRFFERTWHEEIERELL